MHLQSSQNLPYLLGGTVPNKTFLLFPSSVMCEYKEQDGTSKHYKMPQNDIYIFLSPPLPLFIEGRQLLWTNFEGNSADPEQTLHFMASDLGYPVCSGLSSLILRINTVIQIGQFILGIDHSKQVTELLQEIYCNYDW